MVFKSLRTQDARHDRVRFLLNKAGLRKEEIIKLTWDIVDDQWNLSSSSDQIKLPLHVAHFSRGYRGIIFIDSDLKSSLYNALTELRELHPNVEQNQPVISSYSWAWWICKIYIHEWRDTCKCAICDKVRGEKHTWDGTCYCSRCGARNYAVCKPNFFGCPYCGKRTYTHRFSVIK